MNEIKLENVRNTIVGSTVTTEGGDVLVNGQKVTNIFYSAQSQDLKNQRDKLQERFDKSRQKIEKYPNDVDFKVELQKIVEERKEVQKKLDDLKREVINLAETFTKVPINTDRLKLAKQYFEAGNYPEARAILDAEQMGSELGALLQEQEQLERQQTENAVHLIDKANEFLILAQLTQIDLTLPDRYEKTVAYFVQSLKAAHTQENIFAYAYFLEKHNQYTAASPWYEEALVFYRQLAEANPDAYLPYVALTLNNLAILYRQTNRLDAAEKAYGEALETRRQLEETNPKVYLRDVAQTLNNLAILYNDTNRLGAAEKAYVEALGIYRQLVAANPGACLPGVAATLNNLANLYSDTNRLGAAEKAYDGALEIRRQLAEANPEAYLPDIAATLNNLAILYSESNRLGAAEKAYDKALEIRRQLATANPEAYLPDVAQTLYNLAILYSQTNRLDAAGKACDEALGIYRQLAAANPEAYLSEMALTLHNLAILYRHSGRMDEAI